ncbi:amonabactin biosynthesis isochorismate synthase AmoC [soil metagenome]
MENEEKIPTTDYNALWARPGLTLAGRGERRVLDPGSGPDRYRRALQLLADTGADLAFASFTFDPGEEGSLIVVPERVDRMFGALPGDRPTGTIDEDDAERWPKMVSEALVEIERGRVEKVVLSRRLRATFEQALDPFSIAAYLIGAQPGCHVYAMEGLVGASPELLLRTGKGHIESMPLAGSATDQRPDLQTLKNEVEHRLAADSVGGAFAAAGLEYTRSEPSIVEVGEIRHLGTRFEGTTPEDFDFGDILPHLHPTAAVAGTPTSVAMSIINDMEETSRGRYSGPVGWFDREGNCEFAVALRCGLLTGTTAVLRSGAGIVAGSNPDDELEETVWKLKPMLDALGLSSI